MVAIERHDPVSGPADGPDGWKDSLRKVCLYTVFFLIIYSLWIGLRMGEILGAGGEMPALLKAAHVHTLGNSFLILFLLYDLRIKSRAEKLGIGWGLGEMIIGVALLGHVLNTIGFSLAYLHPEMTGMAMALVGIGGPVILYSVLGYVIVAILAEMYK